MEISKARRERWEQVTRDGAFNRWLAPQVAGPDGKLDLDLLHAVALGYGIDRRVQYAHLNPGQQRMNLGNLLRKVVPNNIYDPDIRDTSSVAQSPLGDVSCPNAIERASVRELLGLHGEVMEELRRREIVRTSNSPVGDYAELLFSTAFGWALEGSSASGHDATDKAGIRYQIKSRRLTSHNTSRQLSFLRRLPERKFDYLAGVLFDSNYAVIRAIILPHEGLEARCRFSAHANGWLMRLDDDCWNMDGARDVTDELKAVSDTI